MKNHYMDDSKDEEETGRTNSSYTSYCILVSIVDIVSGLVAQSVSEQVEE